MVKFSKYVVIFILLIKVVILSYNQFYSYILSFIIKFNHVIALVNKLNSWI